MRWRFAEYVLDLERRQLLQAGAELHLSPKALRLLQILVENQPRALSKKELYDALWPDTFVTESNLAGLIGEVRDTLSDRDRPASIIRTVHGFGYAFAGGASPITEESSPASPYRLLWGTRAIVLPEGETVLGRDPDAGVHIDDTTVSRHHARIRIDGDIATIEDLESKNGTRVSGQRVLGVFTLSDGDQLELGSVEMRFRSSATTESTITIADLVND